MPLDQLFESGAGSTSTSLSCLRGYQSNMAPGTVKRSIVKLRKKDQGKGKKLTLEILTE